MISPGCLRTGFLIASALGRHASEAELLDLETHLAGCPRCRVEHGSFAVLRRLEGWEPPSLSAAARERVRRAALAAQELPVRLVGRRLWPLAVGAAALALVAALWVGRAPSSRIVDGDVVAEGHRGRGLRDGARLQALRGGRVVLDGPLVVLGPNTSAVWRASTRTVALERGAVTVDVDPGQGRRFRVATTRFTVEVVGTRFTVDLEGVRTERGKVRVLDPSGEPLATVGAGESWTLPSAVVSPPVSAAAASAPVPATATASPTPTPLAKRSEPPVPPRPGDPDRLARARQALARGDAAEARAVLRPLLRRSRYAAEARLVEAESFLVEGRYSKAIEHYHAVVHDFDGAPQAESALFAMGQLESERGRLDDATRGFSRYLDRYPHGRYAREAQERIHRLARARAR